MRNRGATLATTLAFTALILVVGLALAASSVHHLYFANGQTQVWQARSAADAAIALAIEKVVNQTQFGQAGTEVIEVEIGDAVGKVSFRPGDADGWSTNNRHNQSSTAGWDDRVIPADAVHLLSVGRSGEKTRKVEMILHVPRFPYALASSGPIVSKGALLVGGVEDLGDALPSVNQEKLQPADIACNALGESVRLEGQALIKGNIESVGTIELFDNVRVEGHLKPGSDPIPIQRVELEELRPTNSTELSQTRNVVLTGTKHFNRNNLVLTGGLDLQDGVLYVNGDLTVRGGVKGRGALLVNGRVTIHDGAALAAENQVALLAKDTVTIAGLDRGSSFFQGLVYTEGDLVAHDVTLMGAFVANRPKDGLNPGSRMLLENAGVIHLDGFSAFETEAKRITFKVKPVRDNDPFAGQTFEIYTSLDEWTETLEQFTAAQGEGTQGNSNFLVDKLLAYGISVDGHPFSGTQGEEENGLLHSLTSLTRHFSTNGESGPIFSDTTVEPAFRFDLNEFLSETSRTRILYSRYF